MTYTIVQPTVNTNTSYKDTGRLSWYKYEDLQVLAELFAQANACLVCDAKNDARGGTGQLPAYTTLWQYLGNTAWGSPSWLAPQKQYLDYDRVQYMVDGTFALPDLGNVPNASWLYVTADPFGGYPAYMHRDDRLSAAGTTAGTYAIFGDGDVDMKTQDTATQLGLNMPFDFRAWTDPRDLINAYADAKTLSEQEFNMLTWNADMTRSWALGQAFDQNFVYSEIQRRRRTDALDYAGQETVSNRLIDSGWSNNVFQTRDFWEKRAVEDGSHPDQYIYEWTSEVDSLEIQSGHPVFERNVPIPTSTFGTECLQGRKVLFVWEAVQTDRIKYNDTSEQAATTTAWYGFTADLTKYGTADFADYLGNNRGLCMKYTFPSTAIAQQHTAIKNLLSWSIPQFTQSWTPITSHYVDYQSQELNIYLKGCYSLQKSWTTEILTRP